jgi:hypothetical protein
MAWETRPERMDAAFPPSGADFNVYTQEDLKPTQKL